MQKPTFEELHYCIFRVIMGTNMLIHGAVRIFGDYSGFIGKMEAMFAPTFLPKLLVSVTANLISPVELIFGFMLIIGFKTRLSILVLNLSMLVLISGVCILQKWDLAGMQMGYVIFLFLLGICNNMNRLSVDGLRASPKDCKPNILSN